jgi:hypothetical protein
MIVFRIEREKYLNTTLTGIGASMVDGYTWNLLNPRMCIRKIEKRFLIAPSFS